MSSVGQGVGAVVGGVVGFFTLGGPTGALQGASYGAAIGGALDPADVPGNEGPRLSDASEQTSGFGIGIPRVDGTVRVAGTVIWIENNTRREVSRKTKSSGGKGGGSSQETTTYEYYGTFAVLLADNQVDAIKRVWDSRGLLLNTTSTDIGTTIESSGLFPLGNLYNPGNEAALKAALQTTPTPGAKGQIRLYPGYDDQMPDPRVEADLGVGNTPAFRGCAYAVFYDFPLPAEYGQSIVGAQLSFELITNASAASDATLLSLTRFDNFTGYTLGHANYITPERVSIYYAKTPVGSNPPDGYGVKYVSPYGLEPAPFIYPPPLVPLLQSDSRADAFGLSSEDFGPIGLLDSGDINSSFPNNTDLDTDGTFAEKNGVWWGIHQDRSRIYVAENGTNALSFIFNTAALLPFMNVAAGDDGYGYFIGLTSIYVYDQELTLIKIIDTTGMFNNATANNPSVLWCTIDNGFLYIASTEDASKPETIYRLNLEDETEYTSFGLPFSLGGSASLADSNFNVSGSIVIRFGNLFVGEISGSGEAYVDFFRIPSPNPDGVPLATVVRTRLEESELMESADIDVTDLDQTVRGYKTAGPGSIRQRIEPLMLSHHFDLTMSGYQLKAVKRGNASAMTIDYDDLDARQYGAAPGVALAHSREMDTQLPSVVVVKSLDADRDYEVNQQQSQTMAASKSVNVKEITLAEVFTPDETAGIAEILWTRSWLERTSFTFSLPQTYRALEATDVVTLTTPDATYELYLISVTYTLDNRVECTAVLNDSAVYTPNAVGSAGTASATTVDYAGPAVMNLLDIPAITDTFDDIGFPAALAGYSTTWPGGVIAESNNGGQSYQPIQGYSGAVVSGVVPTALPTASQYVTDTTNTLTVQLYNSAMSISSITKAEMMTGKNWAAYGVAGRWEIIRFSDVTVNADDTISLTTMIRGCKGTEQYMSEHAADDLFIFLSDSDMAFIERASTQIGVSLLYKGVTANTDIDDVAAQTFSYTGVNLKPWSAVYPEVTDTGDIVITWKRRSRLESSYWTTGVQIPLGESTESYEIDILSGSTVLRTLTATSQTVTYTSAQQTADSNSADSAIIYQISATVGRGYGTEVAI